MFLVQISSAAVFAKRSSTFKMPKSSSSFHYSAPKVNSNPRYIAPRKDIPVPKTQYVKPYIKKNGTVVNGYTKASKGSLKPYYNPSYQKKK